MGSAVVVVYPLTCLWGGESDIYLEFGLSGVTLWRPLYRDTSSAKSRWRCVVIVILDRFLI